ncbi:MAG: endonuclease domain-containing protein [bacterium]|nr:endonuclease domain-containing protein [bacterium]
MKEYTSFIFESYSFNERTGILKLHYNLDNEISFTETITFPRDGMFRSGVDSELLDRAFFALHLIGGISYYKTYCPKSIEVRSGSLSSTQALFWNTVYTKGLAEFFYRNNIDSKGLINFPFDTTLDPKPIDWDAEHERVLVPVGGGKDSIVTIEMLRESKMDMLLMRMGKHPLIEEIAKVAKQPILYIERELDPRLFELNNQDAFNGHVPITAYVSFLSIITALLYGCDFITFSNERSANEGNIEGLEVNHQWSKSMECERMIQLYIHSFLTPNLDYFSLLRTMSELLISSNFSQLPQYFQCATSCNTNWKLAGQSAKRWCCTCPKCAFVYSQLAAFLPKKTLMEIFGSDLLAEEALLPLYRQLLGLEGIKPFECVGTPHEVAAAFLLIKERGEHADTPAMEMFICQHLESIADPKALIMETIAVAEEHGVSRKFLEQL